MGRCVTRIKGVRSSYQTLYGKCNVKRPLGKYRPRWKGVMKLYLNEIRCEYVDCIHLNQQNSVQAVGNTVMNCRVP